MSQVLNFSLVDILQLLNLLPDFVLVVLLQLRFCRLELRVVGADQALLLLLESLNFLDDTCVLLRLLANGILMKFDLVVKAVRVDLLSHQVLLRNLQLGFFPPLVLLELALLGLEVRFQLTQLEVCLFNSLHQ